jgi:hypothetical protein
LESKLQFRFRPSVAQAGEHQIERIIRYEELQANCRYSFSSQYCQLSYNLDMSDADHLLQTGSTNGYQRLVSSDRQLDLLECCPDVVLGKYVAITSFDSGPLGLTEAERSAGWASQGEIAYSPEVRCVNTVPQAYFSELSVFSAPTNLGALADPNKNIVESEMKQGQVHAFVNFDFGFHDPGYADLSQMFWSAT